MSALMQCLIAVYMFIALVTSFITVTFGEAYKDYLFFFPNHIYKNLELNIIGCILSSLGILILCPIYCISATFVWLLHIGRKE